MITPAAPCPSGGKGGRNGFEHELRRLGIKQKNGKPSHPQTQGKAERSQQTMKNRLTAQDPQPATPAQLQGRLDAFTTQYNQHRPHKSLPHHATPATACAARPKAAATRQLYSSGYWAARRARRAAAAPRSQPTAPGPPAWREALLA